MRVTWQFAISLLLGSWAAAGPSSAASVFVQWATPTSSGVLFDPVFATNSVPGSSAEAALAPGAFTGTAFSDGASFSSIAVAAYSGIVDLSFTNTGAVSVCFGGAADACPGGGSFPFDIALDADFAHTVDPMNLASASWSQTLIATLSVNTTGDPTRVVALTFQSGESWSGGAAVASSLSIVPSVQNGGVVQVTTGTASVLQALLSMPAIVLDPGESMQVTLSLQPLAFATGTGFTATTDMSAQLRLLFPAGASLASDAGVPLDWVAVPEPASALLVCSALLALALALVRSGTRS